MVFWRKRSKRTELNVFCFFFKWQFSLVSGNVGGSRAVDNESFHFFCKKKKTLTETDCGRLVEKRKRKNTRVQNEQPTGSVSAAVAAAVNKM